MKSHLSAILCLVLLLGISQGAAALDTPPLPEAIKINGITYLSGGIGLTEREQLTAQEGHYRLKLIFGLKEGNYLADVTVSLLGSDGKLLLEAVGGPWFYVDLPAGTYTVRATRNGQTKSREVRLTGQSLRTVRFAW